MPHYVARFPVLLSRILELQHLKWESVRLVRMYASVPEVPLCSLIRIEQGIDGMITITLSFLPNDRRDKWQMQIYNF